MKNTGQRLRKMIVSALFASIIGILAQLAIPIPHIPITGQTLGVGLAATILGAKQGAYTLLLYVFMGAVGVPVFSNFSSGLATIFGPTGGYILCFVPSAWLIGFILEKTSFRFSNAFFANLIGMVCTLLFGTIWFKVISDITWGTAFLTGFVPFIIVGIIKAYLASLIGITIRKQLIRAKLL
ncbi:biotin transporter BioY [Fervidibacillus halotolerans]|uniref:Biotin transporter n=1 Tax=Fervidibacillus halotolerans TaxID=2980027 RepID=A0A9E8RZG1_9BACI|nr:biotin transporter BioY [Fervidibacillus halotolerans]WAA13308.1 biotin transporter BioY [Fervidibacillus halotolerans]